MTCRVDSRNVCIVRFFFFFSSRRRHTRCSRDWSSDVCSSDLAAAAAPAQLAVQQPTEKLLLLPLAAKTPTDSVTSVAVMDLAREKLAQLVRYKVMVVPKQKLCEALKASDFVCDVLLDESQANLLAKFLTVNAYTTGTFEHNGATLVARIRVRDIGS